MKKENQELVRAGRWLLREQILGGGDWQVKVKGVEPGGWAFEFENDLYPDTDDSAEVLMALARTSTEGGPDEKRRDGRPARRKERGPGRGESGRLWRQRHERGPG